MTHPLLAHMPETQPYWSAARVGRLLLPRCTACGRHHWYPRGICPHCLSGAIEWTESTGAGSVYSHTTQPASPVPRVLAYVRLDEGVTLLARLEGAEPGGWRIGARVRVAPQAEGDEVPVPVGRPEPEARP